MLKTTQTVAQDRGTTIDLKSFSYHDNRQDEIFRTVLRESLPLVANGQQFLFFEMTIIIFD